MDDLGQSLNVFSFHVDFAMPFAQMGENRAIIIELSLALLLLNGLNRDKEVTAPLFKTRRLGLRPLETPCFLGKNSLVDLPSTSLNREIVTCLSYLSHSASTGSESYRRDSDH